MRGFVLPALLLLFVGCFRPSEQRAERDLEVGKAKGGGAEIEVIGGLAAVRSLTSRSIVLWGGAPSFDARVRFGETAAGSWVVELRNGMPDARLESDVGVVAVESEPLPTRKRWTLEVDGPSTVSLRFRSESNDRTGPFRFAVLSDIQSAIDRVQDVFDRIDAEPELAFVWTAGDLTESGSADQMDRFQRELEALGIPMFGTLGNHDTFESPTPWHGKFGRCNVHFWYRGVAFTAVDSADGTLDPLVYDWLDTWTREGRGHTHLFATHIPILDPIGVRGGGFASRNEAAKLLAVLAGGGVDATFYGHIHSYYAFENAGIPAYISGGGGAIPERFDGVGRHFLVVRVDGAAGFQGVDRIDVD